MTWVTGRQVPAPGSQRANAMTHVKGWLIAHPSGGTYTQVARLLGLSVNRVTDAALDLHLFDPDIVVAIPAPKNGYVMRAGWSLALRQGEGNQARHAATRLARLAIRWTKIADNRDRAGDHGLAATLRLAARNADHEASELLAVARIIE